MSGRQTRDQRPEAPRELPESADMARQAKAAERLVIADLLDFRDSFMRLETREYAEE